MSNNGATDSEHDDCEASCSTKCWNWDVEPLMMQGSKKSVKYAVLILNRPIIQKPSFVKSVWNNATIRMTVDGGTRQWDRFLSRQTEDARKSIKLPDLVTGDFDSITEEILEKYKKKGCKVIQTPDPSHTDSTKALMELNVHCSKMGIEMNHVLVFGQSSGRLDQTLGNIQTLFLAKDKMLLHPNTRVYLLSDDALSWLLSPGYHYISIPEDTRNHIRAWCALIPIGETCQSVTSTGLKWNLENQTLKFGDLVSTSNKSDGSEFVTIRCSHTILWSMRIPSVMGP